MLLLGQAIDDRALGKAGVSMLVRGGVDEGQQLAVALLDVVDVAAGEEAFTKETNLPLDASFLVSPVRAAQAQLHVQGAAEVEQQGMETSGIAVALEHDNLGIVEEPLPCRDGEIGRCADQPAQERVHGGVEAEFA